MKSWWKIWFALLAIKFLISAYIPLSQDECYYWVWSQHLQLSYFDHPPAVAWLFKLGSLLPEFAIRWPAILTAHLGLFFWRKLFEADLSELQHRQFLLLACLIPLVGPGSLIVTPDLPLMLTWPMALMFAAALTENPKSISNLVGLGLALGLAALSKYHAVLLLPIIFIWFWQAGSFKKIGSRFFVVIALAALVSSPVWLWNALNDWASFRFQFSHGLGAKVWKPNWTFEYIGAQVGLLFPPILFLAFYSPLKKRYAFAAIFPLIFFLLTSYRGYVEANWPIMAHPVVLLLAVSSHRTSRAFWLKTSAAIWFGLTALVLSLALMSHLPNWAAKTKLRDLTEFDGITYLSQNASPLFARSYQLASQLSYRLKRPVHKLAGMNRHDFYDELAESTPKTDQFYLWTFEGDVIPAPYSTWKSTTLLKLDPNFLFLRLEKP